MRQLPSRFSEFSRIRSRLSWPDPFSAFSGQQQRRSTRQAVRSGLQRVAEPVLQVGILLRRVGGVSTMFDPGTVHLASELDPSQMCLLPPLTAENTLLGVNHYPVFRSSKWPGGFSKGSLIRDFIDEDITNGVLDPLSPRHVTRLYVRNGWTDLGSADARDEAVTGPQFGQSTSHPVVVVVQRIK